VRVLFASTRGAGHFDPLVPFIEACLRCGHEVLVAGPPSLRETVESPRYPFWPGEMPPQDELDAIWAVLPSVSPEEANRLVIGEIFGGLNVRAMLPRPPARSGGRTSSFATWASMRRRSPPSGGASRTRGSGSASRPLSR